jgi:hypothetical protein
MTKPDSQVIEEFQSEFALEQLFGRSPSSPSPFSLVVLSFDRLRQHDSRRARGVARDRGQPRCRLVREWRRRGRWTSERSQDRERRTLPSRKISLIRLRLKIEILRKNPKGNPDDYEEEDIKHMRKVRQSR